MLHELDNGVCVTCDLSERKFNPAEPRNPHGEWGHGLVHDAEKVAKKSGGRHRSDGMPPSIVETSVKTINGSVLVGADPGHAGSATLSSGGRSVTLDSLDLRNLRTMIINAQYGDERKAGSDGVFRLSRTDPSGHTSILVSLRPVDGKYVSETGKKVPSLDAGPEDEEVYSGEFDLVVGEGADSDFADEPKARISLKDLLDSRRSLYETLSNTTAAQRVDTGAGHTDVFVPRPGAVGLRTEADTGEPAEVVLNARDYRRVDAALYEVVYGDDELNDAELAQERDVRKVIETSSGPVEVRFHGRYQHHGFSDDSSLTVTPQPEAGWRVTATGAGIERLMAALSANGDAAGVGER